MENKILIMISGGPKFWDGKKRIAIWFNVTIKLQKAIISLHMSAASFKVSSCAALCTAIIFITDIFMPF